MKKSIVLFGDSNTYGYTTVFDGRFDEEIRWPCLLQKHLGDAFLVNAEGLSGRTCAFEDPFTEGLSGVSMITPLLNTHSPVSVLVIMLGTNDVKERFSSNAANIALGLQRLLQKAIATPAWQGAPKILVIAPPPMLKNYQSLLYGASMGDGCCKKCEELPAAYAEMAQKYGCAFLDAGSIPGVVMNELDGMHLTEEAHALLAKAVADKLLKEADFFGI